MNPLRFFLPLSFVIQFSAIAAEAPPEKALRYHEALLKRPSNAALYDRFFGAWIDERDIASLELFLKGRAEGNGGADLSILARHHLRRGDEDAALVTLGKAITALPGEYTLPLERAKLLLRRLEFEDARKDLEAVAAGDNGDLSLEASKLIGKSWLREGKPEQAIQAWDKLLTAHPGDEDLLEDLVESAAMEGETEQALRYVDKLIAAGADPYKKTLRQLRRGDLLIQAGRHDDAITAYSATLSMVGEGSWLERELLAQIDKAYRQQDRTGDLKTKLAELAEANPRRLLIHRQLAQVEAAQGETDAAIGRFREVLKRSPGDRELREEFIRMLTDGEKFDEAATELEKLIALAPSDTALLLQMADLRNREGDKDATLVALEKAHAAAGDDEAAGIRISGLMFQYGLGETGEKLLVKLAAADGATIAPSEALASEYARTNRKPEALTILRKIASSGTLETVLRSAASISALGESAAALEALTAKLGEFGQEPRFLAAISQAALAAGKSDLAATHSVKLVRLSRQGADLAQSVALALRAIADAGESAEWRETFEKQDTLSVPETCLLAALADAHSDFAAVTEIMGDANDPVAIRFHAALLDRRAEFQGAIAVLSSLAGTDEGRKASYFKDMTDLQRRAGLTEDALATVELWKQSAPGDKSAWITGAGILRSEGRMEEAAQALRPAVARFAEDTDLAATLASIHAEAGETEDAEAIYWRLYESSENPSDQAGWAVRLAELAMRTGRTEELGEKLRERARGNRQSIGPILAQAELARLTQDDEKRRDLLLEAVRLQPGDIDLRLQVANLEEQSGNPERVIAILEEAVAANPSDRLRSALAQAYLRQGRTLKGMRELRALAGKQADDPRIIEQSAAGLAGAGLYEEAIRFLREALPDGGDWRTRYLLATMLEHDGRETEAIPLFQTLLRATGEIQNVSPPQQNNRSGMESYSEPVKAIVNLMQAGQAAYAHRTTDNTGYYNNSQQGAKVGPFVLPNSVESVRTLSTIHLAKLGAKDLDNAEFINELTEGNRGQADFPALLAKYPDQPGLLDITLMYGAYGNRGTPLDKDLLRRLLAKKGNLSLQTRFQACMVLMRDAGESDPVWEEIVGVSREMAKDGNESKSPQTGFMLLRVLTDETVKVPEKNRKELSSALIGLVSGKAAGVGPFQGLKLAAISSIGTTDQLIAAMNSEVEDFRNEDNAKAISPARQMQSYYGNMGYNQWGNGQSPFKIPGIEGVSMSSVPPHVLSMIRTADERGGYMGFKPVDPGMLVPLLEKITSPALRAWIAIRSGDATATEKALAATPPEHEKNDFTALRAYQATVAKDYPTAYRLFSELRPAYSSDRNLVSSLNFTLLAIAAEMEEEEREEIAGELRALLIQSRSTLGPQAGQILAAHSELLGMPELAKRFQPPVVNRGATGASRLGAATLGRRNQSSSGGNASIEKMRNFSTTGKTAAAAMEALNLIRKANANPHNGSYELRQIKESISPEVTKELFKMTDPGESKSLTKLLEYADICADFGKPEEARAVLSSLHEQRPDDASIAGKLAFLLPEKQRAEAIALISKASTNPDFSRIASSAAEELGGTENNLRTFAFFTTVTEWLEKDEPGKHGETNLTWVAYHGKRFLERQYLENNLRSLLDKRNGRVQDKKLQERYTALAKRLSLAMLRHPSIAEEGFRLLNQSEGWEIPEKEMDGLARQALLAASALPEDPYSNGSFFTLRMGYGSSSSGDDLDESSSVRWITSRLSGAKSPDEILPPDFLRQIQEKDPGTGTLVSALAGLSDIKELETLWESDAMKKSNGPAAKMLRGGVLARAGGIDGADEFFLKLIREAGPFSDNSGYNRNDPRYTLFEAALNTASAGDPKHLGKICAAISNAVYGEKIDFDKPGDGISIHRALSVMEALFQSSKLQPAAAARIIGAFYSLGVPVASQDYYLAQPFKKVKITNKEEGEKAFEALGWLDGAATWKPLAAILMETNHNAGKVSFIRKDELLQPRAFSYMNFGISHHDMAKHLEQRKPATFGSLITAAALVEGSERARLTEKAFTLAAPEISKMKPGQVSVFTPVLPWLPVGAMKNLPASFREKADEANGRKREKLVEAAEAFLKNRQPNNQYQSPLDEVQKMVGELAPVDMEKSVELFVAAEKRFTDGLRTGMRLSSSTYSNLEIIGRDDAMYNLLLSSGSPLKSDPSLALRFHKAVSESSAATRMSFAGPRNAIPLLYEIGGNIYGSTPQKPADGKPRWLAALEATAAMPEEIRRDARIALGIWLMGNHSFARGVKLPQDREELMKLKDLPEELAVIRSFSIGISGWKSDKPEGRAATTEALLTLSGDETLSLATRFQFMSVATTMVSDILTDAKLASRFADLFEAYAKEERTVINTLGLQSANLVGTTTVTDANRPFLTRINTAFWENANHPKPGGHPPIPPEYGDNLFLAAAKIGDDANAKKLLAAARKNIAGDVGVIHGLILNGSHAHAKELLATPQQVYIHLAKPPFYDRIFEARFREFADMAGLEPTELLRIEAQFRDWPIPEKDSEKPLETVAEREARLAREYLANPPSDQLRQTDILSSLCRESHTAALLLHDEILALAGQYDQEKNLRRWGAGANGPDGDRGWSLAITASIIVRQAAYLRFLDGDASGLHALADVMDGLPLSGKDPSLRHHSYFKEYSERILQSAPIWIAEAVHREKTGGFKDGFEVFRKFFLILQKRGEFHVHDMYRPLAMAEYFAYWEGAGKKFEQLGKEVTREQKSLNYFGKPEGLYRFAYNAKQHAMWGEPSFAEARRGFLISSFTRKGMEDYYSSWQSWLDKTAGYGLRDDILAISEKMPDGTLPTVLPHLLKFRADNEFREKRFDSGVALTLEAIDACPELGPWNNIHFRWLLPLVEKLITEKKPAEAAAAYGKFRTGKLNENQKKRHEELGKKL